MKFLLIILLIPILAFGQTVHVENDQVIYKGMVKADGLNQEELFARAKKALLNNVTKEEEALINEEEKNKISAIGSIKLKSPYHLIKTVEYQIQLTVKNGEWE